MSTAQLAYRVIGSTDDVTECGLCGRVELRGTVALYTLDADGNPDEVVYYGTSCAAKATGWTQRVVKARVRDADREARERAREEANEAHRRRHAAYEEWIVRTYGTRDHRAVAKLLGIRPAQVWDVFMAA